jgi:tRNA pseudouridine13 synthase
MIDTDTDTDDDTEQVDTDPDPQADAPEPALHAARDAGSLGLTEAELRLLRDPPRQTADLPGVGGRIRARLEDFLVREIPAYPPDGREGAHLLLLLKKRGIGSEDALQLVAERCQIPRAELGLAGLKDTHAVTEQWISAPAAYRAALAAFEHPAVELGPAHPHGNKLRRGHLHGNVFELVLRDLAVPQPLALTRLAAKVSALHERGGLDNLYGEQRLGDGGRNLIRGLALLLGGGARGRRKADFLLSAGQSALFNLYLLERRARGLMRVVLRGDIMRKRATGGLFQSDDPALDQARFDAGELELTGPIFGSKMMAPAPGTPPSAATHPFIGLFGTVLGIIRSFQDLSATMANAGGSNMMAGISEALIATAVGLLVAIPAVIAYNVIMCDEGAEVGAMVHLIDLLRDAGVKKYAIATEKPQPKPGA